MKRTGVVTRYGALDVQVCVPADWTDLEVKDFADKSYHCGTGGGWRIRKEGDPALGGDPERVKCEHDTGFVHVMLDA